MTSTKTANAVTEIPQGCVAFVAAGSGGHIQSALAVLEHLSGRNPEITKRSVFVGSNLNMEGEVKKVSLEETLCQRMGIPFVKMRSGKLQRQFSLSTLRLLGGVILGFVDAWMFFSQYKPKLIVSFGGYSSLPMGVVAWLRGVKLIIHEQTTSVGLTNRILMKIADVSAISYKQSEPFFKRAKNVVMTGSPSREYIFSVKTVAQLDEYLSVHTTPLYEESEYIQKLVYIEEMSDVLPMILIMGGSQGSHIMNETVAALLPELAKDHIVYLQTGDNQVMKDYDKIMNQVAAMPHELQKNIIVRKFIYEEMGLLYHNARQFVGRSGANTVYEIGMMGIPAIFVPIPWVTKNEQYTNAKIIKDLGFAEIIEQDHFSPEVLGNTLRKLKTVKVPPEQKLQEIFPKNAAEKLTKEIVKFL